MNQAGLFAPVGKGTPKGGKPNGVPYNFGKGSSTNSKEKCIQGLGFHPERGEQRKFGGYCNWCWRIGHKQAQCWFEQEYMKSNPSQDLLQRDIGQEKTPGEGNHNQDQAGSPNEDGQRTLGDFGLERQRVEFVGDVPRE